MEKLDFIQQFRAFIRASAGSLDAMEQLVYFRLLGIWNELRRPEWFPVSTTQLMNEIGVKKRNVVVAAKSRLVEHGFILTRNPSRTAVTQFKIVELSTSNHREQASNERLQETSNQRLQADDELVTNGYKTSNQQLQALVTNGYTSQRDTKNKDYIAAAAASPDFAEAVSFFSNNIHPIAGEVEMQKLASFLDDYGKDWTLAAIEEAAESNGRSVKYIGSILERWKRDGFKSDRKGKRYGHSIPGGARPSAAEKMRAEQAKWDAQTSGWE